MFDDHYYTDDGVIRGFGAYLIKNLPPEDKYPFSYETLDELWQGYRVVQEDRFDNIISIQCELMDLNEAEKYFTGSEPFEDIFHFWKSKLLEEELANNVLSPEKQFCLNAFETLVCETFYSMLEAECGSLSDEALDSYDASCIDTEKDFDFIGKVMHVVSPFMLLMLRYAYYQTWLQKTIHDDEFRRHRATCLYIADDEKNGLHLSELHDVNTVNISAKRIYKSMATLSAQATRAYVESAPTVTDEQIDVLTYISLAKLEVTRLNQDEAFLRKYCQPFFVDSLIEWHRGYFAYLINQIHQFKGYWNFQIPGYRINEVKDKSKAIIPEEAMLTPAGRECRKTIIDLIHKCKTNADYGLLLYELQKERKWFTENKSRKDYYRFMRQLAHVSFCPSDDFANCDKGYNDIYLRSKKKW